MKKKFKLNAKGFFNKKENVAILSVAVICCCGIAAANLKQDTIPLHDGDVLVDSQNIAQTGEAAGETSDEPGSFDEKKAKLELERNDLIAKYDDTIKNSKNKAEKKNAVTQKEKLSGFMEQEVAVEGIIQSKNLPDSFVIITDNSVTVTLDEQDLTQNTVAKICNIVMEETKRTADQIIIQSNY